MQLTPYFFRRFSLVLGVALLLLTGCENKDKKKSSQPPPQAMAPAIQEPDPAPPAATPAMGDQQSEPQQPDAAAAMITEAEKAYQSGLSNYKAGHLDAAKEDFNRAVDVLMQGPIGIKADDRLQHEFDKITGEINRLEMTAFKEGDGFTEQQPEAAPIDEANQLTFPADPSVKAKAEAELQTLRSDLPLVINDYVAGYINYFSTRGRETFESALARSGRYRDMIFRIFKEEGIPQDLIYLAQAESGFKPLALSRARARGMWQFMASRGAGYGLHRSWWVDDRQDPEKATRAAARHLKDLYKQFGDWYLAMAAYNSGPGNVQQAVRRTGYADFWELYKRNVLPPETKNYVPIILAMIIMSKNPEQYGLDRVQLDPPERYDVVRVNYPIDLRLVAECVGAPVHQLVELNPSLLRHMTPRGRPFDLHLPLGTADKYKTAVAAIPQNKRVAWRYHTVRRGDTLSGIARKYHTSVRAIKQANDLRSSLLRVHVKLAIPVRGSIPLRGIVYSRHPTHYKVHRGDTVLSVAADFGVPPSRLRRWNRLKGNKLRHRRSLVIYKPLAPGESDKASNDAHRKKTNAKAKPSRAKSAEKTSGASAP